ncbi:MAG: PQQ-binding-like beta-propeller repeat protein [Planctomycetes bacterium]|nr:PQQ-binding-like beta-propeller repeat protein [Planctomycetota bacterium]
MLRILKYLLGFGIAAGSAQAASWPMKQRDIHNTGRADFIVPASRMNHTFFDVFAWQKRSPESPSNGSFTSTSMVFFDGAGPGHADIVVGGFHWPKGVQGMDRHSGSLFWSGNPGGGEAIGANTPAFSNDGTIVYVTNDSNATPDFPNGFPLMAFSTAVGPSIFRHNGADANPGDLGAFSPKIAPEGRIFLHAWVDRPYAGTDLGTSIVRTWAAQTPADCGLSDTALYVGGGGLEVAIGARYGAIVYYDGNTGAELWRQSVAGMVDAPAAIDPTNGNIYVGAGDSSIFVVGLDRFGSPLWSEVSPLVYGYSKGQNNPERAQAAGCLSHDGQTYYFQTNSQQGEGHLYAINTVDGSVKWSLVTGCLGWEENNSSSPIVTSNGVIIVGNNDAGTYFAIHDDGESASILDTLSADDGSFARASATLAPDGKLYLPVRTTWVTSNGDGEIPNYQTENVFSCFNLNDAASINLPVPSEQAAMALNHAVLVSWNPIFDPLSQFDHYAIYRDTAPFSSTAGMTQIGNATNINTSNFLDNSASNGVDYYYAVTSVSVSGGQTDGVYSIGPRVPGPPGSVTTRPFYSTVLVTWDPVSNPDLAGYEVYRRTADGSYPSTPIKRVLVRSSFTDYGLSPGEAYFYKVTAIDGLGHRIKDFTNEQSATLLSSATGLSKHKNFELLIAFYTGGFTEDDITRMTAGLKKGIEFYWRTTRGRLNMDVTWLYINEETPGTSTGWDSIELQNDLRARGVQDNQYDLAFLVGNDLAGCLGGYVVFGSTCASLGTVCGVPYPENDPGIDYTIAWTFTHEIHHALETMENITGPLTPDVLFCHFPWDYPDPLGPTGVHMDWGPHYDGIAQTNRTYGDQWMLFPAPFDGYIECVDADGDGFPDQDDRVPMDEVGFGSSTSSKDTDHDGLHDLAEYSAYNFRGTNPQDPDSDGDGIPDGSDHQPLYRCSRFIPLASLVASIDGIHSQQENWRSPIDGYYFTQSNVDFPLRTYISYEPAALYFAFETDRPLRFKISVDGSGVDGRFESPVRYVTGATDTYNSDNKGNQIGDSWGDGNHIYTAFGADSVGVFDRDLITDAQVASTISASSIYTTEIRVPRALPAGAAYTWYPPDAPVVDGLTLNPGHVIGLNITCSDLADSDNSEYSGTWTSVFETHSFVDFILQFDLRNFAAMQDCFGHSASNCGSFDVNLDGTISISDFRGVMTDPG